MWIRTYSKIAQDVGKDSIWKAWSDLTHWHKWNPGVEYARMDGKFAAGGHFFLKPNNMKEVRIELVEVEVGKRFRDCTISPGAKMYGIHEIAETKDGLILTTSMKVEGWLSFLWIFLVARGIVAKIPEQTDRLIEFAKKK